MLRIYWLKNFHMMQDINKIYYSGDGNHRFIQNRKLGIGHILPRQTLLAIGLAILELTRFTL